MINNKRNSTGKIIYDNKKKCVYKNIKFQNEKKTIEGAIYKMFTGRQNISKGRVVEIGKEQKIKTPMYKQIISVDDTEKQMRKNMRPIINMNFEKIISSINTLSINGISYNDLLQYGINDNNEMKLIDFSNAKITNEEEATKENYMFLRRYLKEFGAHKYENIIGEAIKIYKDAKWLSEDKKLMLEKARIIEGKSQSKKAIEMCKQGFNRSYTNIYYSYNQIKVQSKTDTNIIKAHTNNGIYIFSDNPLDKKTIEKWELTKIKTNENSKYLRYKKESIEEKFFNNLEEDEYWEYTKICSNENKILNMTEILNSEYAIKNKVIKRYKEKHKNLEQKLNKKEYTKEEMLEYEELDEVIDAINRAKLENKRIKAAKKQKIQDIRRVM